MPRRKAKDGDNGKGNGKSIQPQRGPHGHFLPGHAPPSPGPPPTRKITAKLLRLGDEIITLTDEKTGEKVEMDRNEAMARGLWRDALASKSAIVKTHARDCLLKRIDPEPVDTEHTLLPANTQIYAPVTIKLLTDLQEETGGAPTTRDVLDKLAKEVPVRWHENGEATDG